VPSQFFQRAVVPEYAFTQRKHCERANWQPVEPVSTAGEDILIPDPKSLADRITSERPKNLDLDRPNRGR
jgi:hypothetical protein